MSAYLSDEELISRCARGDRGAMDVLVSRYHARLLDFIYRHIQDRETAADIAQCALVKAFQSANRYQGRGSFRTWLYTIALNQLRDEIRRRRSLKESFSLEPDMETASLKVSSPEDDLLTRLTSAEVWRAVDQLDDNRKMAMILRFRREFTYEEISAVMGVPLGTVKSWVHYGLRKLRVIIGTESCED